MCVLFISLLVYFVFVTNFHTHKVVHLPLKDVFPYNLSLAEIIYV